MRKLVKISVTVITFCFFTILLQKALIAQTNSTCCRYCSTGKACGNACIPKNEVCKKPLGCACNGIRTEPTLVDELRKDINMIIPPTTTELFRTAPTPQGKTKLLNFKVQQVFSRQDSEDTTKITQNTTSHSCSVPISISTLRDRNVVVKKRKLKIRIFEAGVPDGDVATLVVDGKAYGAIVLTRLGQQYEIDLGDKQGDHVIQLRYVRDGGLRDFLRRPVVTVGIAFKSIDVVEFEGSELPGSEVKLASKLTTGQTAMIIVGFPQIKISISKCPRSGCHIAEAWRIPPVPMEQPIPGKPGNPLRPSYPRVLTIVSDAMAKTNRRLSTKNYKCPKRQDRDEYPQATFAENAGSAHIKCIEEGDNRGSGASIVRQMERYGSRQVKLLPSDTIELLFGS